MSIFQTKHPRSGKAARLATALMLAALTTTGLSLPAQAQGSAKAAVPPPPVLAVPDVVGVWIDHTKQGAVEIKPCGGKICGYVVWIQNPLDAKGRPLVDDQNPDPKKRKTPMCGLQIIGDASPDKSGQGFESGWIYNPEDGVRYDVDVKPVNRERLMVTGYLGIRLLGESFTWVRAPATLERCKV